MKLIALQRLHDLSKYCVASITYHETHIELDGQPNDIITTSRTLVELLEDIQIVQHPILISPTLCQSFNNNTKGKNVPSIVVNESGISYICSAGAEAARYAKNHIKNPIKARVYGAAPDVLLSLRPEIAEIEKKHIVEVTMKDKECLNVWGYVSADVRKAKEALIELVHCKTKTQQALNCTPQIASYLHHILFVQERSSSVQLFVSSLQAQLLSADGQLLIEGTEDVLKDVEDKLIRHLFPPELMFESIEYNCNSRFLSQIKQDYLHPLKKQFNFTYVITDSSDEGFTVIVYSKNHKDLEAVITNMKVHCRNFNNQDYIKRNWNTITRMT